MRRSGCAWLSRTRLLPAWRHARRDQRLCARTFVAEPHNRAGVECPVPARGAGGPILRPGALRQDLRARPALDLAGPGRRVRGAAVGPADGLSPRCHTHSKRHEASSLGSKIGPGHARRPRSLAHLRGGIDPNQTSATAEAVRRPCRATRRASTAPRRASEIDRRLSGHFHRHTLTNASRTNA